MKPTNIPNEEQSKLFDAYIVKWQVLLNLCDWRIEKGNRPAKNAMASVEFNGPARLATYKLGDWGHTPITEKTLEQTAVHELMHVVLYDLVATSANRDSNSEDIETAEHRVVNLFERLLTKE
jgi:hypothetical protein